MITVALSNKDTIFDSGKFKTVQEAIAFSKGRGGKYVVQIGREDSMGISLSYDSDKDTFSRNNGWEWEPISEDDIQI